MIDIYQSKKVLDVYPELFHYTTAAGLEGIISSQSLWATHFGYLNDSYEYKLFFDGELREIIKDGIRPTIQRSYESSDKSKKTIDQEGGIEAYIESLISRTKLVQVIREIMYDSFEPYIISFCGGHANKPNVMRDGLLSQWRGYGADGGYAIEFDTKEIYQLFTKETNKYQFNFSNFCDVNYFDRATSVDEGFPQKIDIKRQIQDIIHKFFFEGVDKLDDISQPIWAMATAQKHSGFSEEAEVRIVLIPVTKEHVDKKFITLRSDNLFIDYEFINRNGLLVPYITLFKGDKLPIKRIIVGPHKDSNKRQKSVQMMLAKYAVNAEVTVSHIPYTSK